MAKLTKKQKETTAKVDNNKAYSVSEAASLVKEVTTVNFDASVDIAVRLNVDPRKANQMVRGVVTLPHGTGKDIKVLALVTPDKEAEATAAGADYVGLDEYLAKIKGGWTDVDVIVTMPSVMGKLGPLGRVLGPRGLMPNPKTGTVTMDVAKAVAPDTETKVVGIRPGEKLHEQMIGAEDSYYTYEYPEHFKILPTINNWGHSPERVKDGKLVPEGFVYSSDNNEEWMSVEELQGWVEKNKNKIGKI